jgi:predicted ABC-class ATPase
MKSELELQNMLRSIDHKGYPAYKDLKGKYQFKQYILSIDHVQGDPFASPSKVSIIVPAKIAAFDKEYYENPARRTAFQNYLLRRVATQIKGYSFKAKGSGKSGLMGISQPGQEVMELFAWR